MISKGLIQRGRCKAAEGAAKGDPVDKEGRQSSPVFPQWDSEIQGYLPWRTFEWVSKTLT